MKRIISCTLALVLAAALLAGCGGKDQPNEAQNAAQSEAAAGTESQSAAAPQPEHALGPAAEEILADPLTGLALTTAGQRPVAIMVNSDSAPAGQWGVSRASVMVEALTTGRQTELLCLYPSVDSLEKVGPVTGGDDLYLQLVLPINAIPVQINKTVYASNLLNLLHYQDLDGFYTGVTSFDYDSERGQVLGNESCSYTTSKLLRDGLALYGASAQGTTGNLFRFGESQPQNEGQAQLLNIVYSENDTVALSYNSGTGLYERSGAEGALQTDALNGETVAFTNVLVLYAAVSPKDDGHHWDYDLTSGTGLYLTKGGWQTITWSKGDVYDKLTLCTAEGEPLALNPGKSYLGFVGGMNGQRVVLYNGEWAEQPIPQHE